MKRTLLYPKKENRLNGRLLGSAPRGFHPHAVLARPYLLPATPRHLNMVARSGCSCKGVSLSCCELSPAGCHTCFASLCCSLALAGSWRTVRSARHQQIVSVCLILPGIFRLGFLCQRARQHTRKGVARMCLRALYQLKA